MRGVIVARYRDACKLSAKDPRIIPRGINKPITCACAVTLPLRSHEHLKPSAHSALVGKS